MIMDLNEGNSWEHTLDNESNGSKRVWTNETSERASSMRPLDSDTYPFKRRKLNSLKNIDCSLDKLPTDNEEKQIPRKMERISSALALNRFSVTNENSKTAKEAFIDETKREENTLPSSYSAQLKVLLGEEFINLSYQHIKDLQQQLNEKFVIDSILDNLEGNQEERENRKSTVKKISDKAEFFNERKRRNIPSKPKSPINDSNITPLSLLIPKYSSYEQQPINSMFSHDWIIFSFVGFLVNVLISAFLFVLVSMLVHKQCSLS